MKPLLTKSKYINGLQCLRYLWLLFHEPQKVPEVDFLTQFRFDQGHEVGELAKKLFPAGVNVPFGDFKSNIAQTARLLTRDVTLFEAGIIADNLYARIDILNPTDNGEWDIIEVKSSTEVKDEHIQDVAFQRLCCERHGLKIRKCSVAYINNKYVRHGEIDPQQIFLQEDVTERVDETAAGIEGRIQEMFEVISLAECPDMPVGTHCSDPYECPVNICRQELPENTILTLHRATQKKYEFFHKGILFIKDIPANFKLTKVQQIQKTCDISCQPHIDTNAIKEFLSTLKYPLYYLDFETFNTAIPAYDGTRPYQQIPFQFSVHFQTPVSDRTAIQRTRPKKKIQFQLAMQFMLEERTNLAHYSFLADGTEDPRLDLLSELKKVLGETGSIIVYNQSFEKRVLTELGKAFPEYKEWAESVCERLVDLYEPFRNFDYYNTLQQGSASIKEVLPAVTGKSYKGMPIKGGEEASQAYLTLMFNEMTDEARNQLRNDLERYCGLDTEGMVWIIEKLKEL